MNMKKKVIITGITGQDGYFLTKLLLKKNYEIYGITRRKNGSSYGNLDSLNPEEFKKINFLYGDIMDTKFIFDTVKTVRPDEIYHLAVQNYVHHSIKKPGIIFKTNFLSTSYLLEAIRQTSPKTAFFMACTSKIFAKLTMRELRLPSTPANPTALSKISCYYLVQMYREKYGLFAVNGVSYNHESEMRGEESLTRRITLFVSQYESTRKGALELGNLYDKIDWGHPEDFVQGFYDSLQQPTPKDYIFATGKSFSVKEFVSEAFQQISVKIIWKGEGDNEVGIDKETNQEIIKISPKNIEAREEEKEIALVWKTRVELPELVSRMVQNDRRLFREKRAKL